MNIRKKISFFTLFLISSFFIMGEVKADFYRYGGSVYAETYGTDDPRNSQWTSSYFAYRFTFVNKDGVIISGTKPVDIWFTGTPITDNLGKKYKFSDKSYNNISSISVSISSCSTDECYMENIINYYKNNTNQFRTKLINNTGNSNFDENEFLVVEKLYTIDIRTTTQGELVRLYDICKGEYGPIKFSDDGYDCESIKPESPTKYNLAEISNNYYTGTGLEILKKINDTNPGDKINNETVPGKNGTIMGIYFIKNNRSVTNFTGLNIYKGDEVSGFKSMTYVDSKYTDFKGRETVPGEISDALNKSKTYGINIFTYYDFNPSCTYNNHSTYDGGRDWNMAAGKCCAKDTYYKGITKTDASGKKIYEGLCCKSGQDYNPNTKKCETVEPECNGSNYMTLNRSLNSKLGICCLSGQALNSKGKSKVVTSCFTKDTTTNNDYTYYCNTSSSMCNDNVNSTINSYTSGKYAKGTTVSSDLSNSSDNKTNESGQCILNNNAYFKGVAQDGVKIYCSETLQTNLNNMLTTSTIRSGLFLPINSPTVSVKHDCYYSPTSGKETYISGIKDLIKKEETAPTITLRFMDKDYTFNSSNGSNDTGSLYSGFETYYGESYVKYSFETTYNYSTKLLNKFVDKRTAKGSNDSTAPINGAAYNGFASNLNISIPTNASGKYEIKYTIGNYVDDIIRTILDNKSETIQKTYDTGKSVQCGGICTVSYNSNKLNCATKANEIKSIFRNGYGSDLQISNTSNSCKFSMQFPVGSQAECIRSKGNDSTLSISYSVTNCTEKVKFETKVTGNKNSCSNYVTVSIPEEIIYRPIDLSNPFPGKEGKGRTAGSNWSKSDITNYITSRQDAYTKVPLYSITLTPTIIEEIRNYNQKNSYDDFTLTCAGGSEGSACYSSFIRKYLTESKSTCYNKLKQNKEAFFSCADYSNRQ